MDKGKYEEAAKALILIISASVTLLVFLPRPHWGVVYDGCPLVGRLTYSFFHANVFHMLANVWVLLSITFLSRISLGAVLCSYLCAVLMPTCLFLQYSSFPTCGLSVMVTFLLGSLSYGIRKPLGYDLSIITFILLGFLLPYINAMAHLYAYAVGWVYGFLFTTHDGTGDR